MIKLDHMIEAVGDEGQVCPMPARWKELLEMFPDRKRAAAALPPIPVAWDATPDPDKRAAFVAHLRYASESGMLEQVAVFLSLLPWDEWHYEGDRDA
jgi:hypothetical protein